LLQRETDPERPLNAATNGRQEQAMIASRAEPEGGPFRFVEGPTAVRQSGDDVPIRYEARFMTPEGSTIVRFLTDKGRAQMLRALDDGRGSFSSQELVDMTVVPDEDRLRARIVKEGGEGA
jgi:hypothetical protein